MKRWLVSALDSVLCSRWVYADGFSQAAQRFAALEAGHRTGSYKVVVYAENSESFTFEIDQPAGDVARIRWLRDWADLAPRPAG